MFQHGTGVTKWQTANTVSKSQVLYEKCESSQINIFTIREIG